MLLFWVVVVGVAVVKTVLALSDCHKEPENATAGRDPEDLFLRT